MATKSYDVEGDSQARTCGSPPLTTPQNKGGPSPLMSLSWWLKVFWDQWAVSLGCQLPLPCPLSFPSSLSSFCCLFSSFSLLSFSCLSSLPFSLFPSVSFYPVVFFGTFCPLLGLWAWPSAQEGREGQSDFVLEEPGGDMGRFVCFSLKRTCSCPVAQRGHPRSRQSSLGEDSVGYDL